MDKKILEDYIDACEFIKETEAEIKKLEKKKIPEGFDYNEVPSLRIEARQKLKLYSQIGRAHV